MLIRCIPFIVLTLTANPVQAEPWFKFLDASTARLDNPHDLKLSPDGKFLLVSDVGNNRVAILDPETLNLIGSFGADHQSGTHDVEFDAQGKLYVADTHNNRVTIYTFFGTSAKQIGELQGGFKGPEGVLAHPNGRIYVAGAWSGNVIAFHNGKKVAELSGLSSPHDLEINPDGDIWLADAGNDRMLLLSQELEIKRQWKGPTYAFDGVRYQDVLSDGTVIAADKNNHMIKVIGADGKLLTTLGSGEAAKGHYVFRTPEGVETRGNIAWFSDSGNDRIVKYRFKFK